MLPSLTHIFRFLGLALLGSALCLGQPRELASNAIPADKLQAYADLAQQWEQEYLRIDTSNPPGNEARAAAFFKRIFDQEVSKTRYSSTSPPGRISGHASPPEAKTQSCPSSCSIMKT